MTARTEQITPFEDAKTFEVIEEEASYSETDGRDCYFCGQNEEDDAAAVEVPMHRHVGMIFYYSATVSVPRCRECKMNHRMAKVLTVSLALAGASLGTLGFIFAVPTGVLAVVMGTIVGAITGSWLGKLNVPYEMKSRSDYHGSPVIGSLIENGWRLGNRPSN